MGVIKNYLIFLVGYVSPFYGIIIAFTLIKDVRR